MKRVFCFLSLACVGLAHAQTTIDDFSVGSSPYVLPTDGDYVPNISTLPGPLFDERDMTGSGYIGNGQDPFTSSISGGVLTSQGFGSAGGELDLAYSLSSGEADLSGYSSVTVTVSSLTAPVHFGWGTFSNSYANESTTSLTISSPGSVTLNFSSLGGDPVALSKIDNLFFDVDVAAGQSFSISKVTANAVPEPAPLAAMGLGVGVLALGRKRKTA
jgi:hypothetical protein